jgi:hypothetical protein
MLDNKAGNHLWKEVEAMEIKALMDYNVSKDLGKGGIPPPLSYGLSNTTGVIKAF